MINHIDLGTVLRRAVCDFYSDLVTRPTGAVVRSAIEQQLAEMGERTLTVIDFSRVGLLDFSCADEIVAKLLLQYAGGESPSERYFLFRGVSESHLDAIEAVLERHGLATVAECTDGGTMLVGRLGDEERRAWEIICRLGRAAAPALARESTLSVDACEALLESLCRRRLIMQDDDAYVPVVALVA
ncbi:MAG TPA: hypothetical protein VFK13_01355 [Gemmatimonadaceae bacterium]|nr:hypothetical protein [Gemmatimonadaceae bacterium]